MSEWYVDKSQAGIRVAKIENRRVTRFDFELKNSPKSMLGAIFMGKVVEVSPKSGMVFVDIGESTPIVLPAKEKKLPPLKRGEKVRVQITRDPILWQDKAAHGSRIIKLEMGPIIYSKDGEQLNKQDMDCHVEEESSPRNDQTSSSRGGQKPDVVIHKINVSKKLDHNDFAFLESEVKDGESVAIRHWATAFDDESILKSLECSRKKWDTAMESGIAAPGVLERLVYNLTQNDYIYTNDRGIARQLDELIQECYGYLHEIEILREPAFSEDIEDVWDSLKQTTIQIPGGGELIIEETHAMVVVDINSGSLADSFHDLNRRALKELSHQIALRNLSGIIVVDLAGNIKHPKQLVQSVKAMVDGDTNVHGISTLGLLELSRKCNGPSLGRAC